MRSGLSDRSKARRPIHSAGAPDRAGLAPRPCRIPPRAACVRDRIHGRPDGGPVHGGGLSAPGTRRGDRRHADQHDSPLPPARRGRRWRPRPARSPSRTGPCASRSSSPMPPARSPPPASTACGSSTSRASVIAWPPNRHSSLALARLSLPCDTNGPHNSHRTLQRWPDRSFSDDAPPVHPALNRRAIYS